MKKHLFLSSLILSLALLGCEDDSGTSSAPECITDCNADEICVDGNCEKKPECEGDDCEKKPECEGDDCEKKPECEGDDCEKKPECEGDDCEKKPECEGDDCEKKPECEGDDCEKKPECEGDDCEKKPECEGDDCQKMPECEGDDCETQNKCNGTCNEFETCVDDACKCGNETCAEDEICVEGPKCEKNTETETPTDEDPTCEVSCDENQICVDGECVAKTDTPVCNPECDETTEYCDENGVCQPLVIEQCGECAENEVCQDGVCKCGNQVCKDDEICQNDKCIVPDPCANKTCPAGQTCMSGECIKTDVSFNKTSVDVMLSSDSIKIIAQKSDTKPLVWTIDDLASDKEMSSFRCKVKTGEYSKKMDDCIIVDNDKLTETIQFLSFVRHPATKTVKVKNSFNATASVTLNLKPYFDLQNFVKVSGLVYKNSYCAGHKLIKSIANYDYLDKKETDDALKANLGGLKTDYGAANPYGKATFKEEEKAVFDKEMYTKYILPNLLKHDGNYYGTRASVVAAARFLILQFPYDIPYQMIGLNNTVKARSHYVHTLHRDAASSISKTRIYGLNLTSNVYNSSINRKPENIIRKTAVPWGAAYDSTSKEKYPYNGLECSGFVTWALNNGRVGLGDWKTKMFAKTGDCKKDGKIVRNYKCKDLVNNSSGSTWSNRNNNLFNAYEKLGKLKDSDFKKLTGKSLSEVKDILKDVKAGDLLWKGKYISKSADTYSNGHIAMIIGLKRDKNGDVSEIEIGEAIYTSGNTLTRKTVSAFQQSSWFNSDYASYIIKMDNVYNYYSNLHEITDKSEKSDCPNNVKSGGNCYNYTESYNDQFNQAITRLK